MLEIYHIETMGTLDGPGVRTVIFLQGCPMKCSYCHNPDSWKSGDGYFQSNKDLIELISRYRDYYGLDGGVTFSGGEPLVQSKELLILVKELKALNIHVTLDTSGCIFNEDVKELIDIVDLVILDIKATDEKKYYNISRQSIEFPLKVLSYMQGINKSYWIRQVILSGINDSEEEKESLEKLTQHTSRQKLEFLQYHSMGLEKWKAWQLKYRVLY